MKILNDLSFAVHHVFLGRLLHTSCWALYRILCEYNGAVDVVVL